MQLFIARTVLVLHQHRKKNGFFYHKFTVEITSFFCSDFSWNCCFSFVLLAQFSWTAGDTCWLSKQPWCQNNIYLFLLFIFQQKKYPGRCIKSSLGLITCICFIVLSSFYQNTDFTLHSENPAWRSWMFWTFDLAKPRLVNGCFVLQGGGGPRPPSEWLM